MNEFRLLERVARWESGTARSNATRASLLIDSVICMPENSGSYYLLRRCVD